MAPGPFGLTWNLATEAFGEPANGSSPSASKTCGRLSLALCPLSLCGSQEWYTVPQSLNPPWKSCAGTSLISKSKKSNVHSLPVTCGECDQRHTFKLMCHMRRMAYLPVTWRHICQPCVQNMTCDLVEVSRETWLLASYSIIVGWEDCQGTPTCPPLSNFVPILQ